MTHIIRSVSIFSLLALGLVAFISTADARVYHTGPEGGCYYITASGNKSYVDRSICYRNSASYVPTLGEQQAARDAERDAEKAKHRAHYQQTQQKQAEKNAFQALIQKNKDEEAARRATSTVFQRAQQKRPGIILPMSSYQPRSRYQNQRSYKTLYPTRSRVRSTTGYTLGGNPQAITPVPKAVVPAGKTSAVMEGRVRNFEINEGKMIDIQGNKYLALNMTYTVARESEHPDGFAFLVSAGTQNVIASSPDQMNVYNHPNLPKFTNNTLGHKQTGWMFFDVPDDFSEGKLSFYSFINEEIKNLSSGDDVFEALRAGLVSLTVQGNTVVVDPVESFDALLAEGYAENGADPLSDVLQNILEAETVRGARNFCQLQKNVLKNMFGDDVLKYEWQQDAFERKCTIESTYKSVLPEDTRRRLYLQMPQDGMTKSMMKAAWGIEDNHLNFENINGTEYNQWCYTDDGYICFTDSDDDGKIDSHSRISY